jgi:hypothetical protein
MKVYFKSLLSLCFALLAFSSFSQIDDIAKFKPNPVKEQMFLPYLATKHGGVPTIESWKKSNTVQYYKELWYFSESFYVKRNHLSEGVTLNEEIIDISRFESLRKPNEAAIVVLPGFKDVLVLLPASQLLYKP